MCPLLLDLLNTGITTLIACRARAASRHVQAWRDTIAAVTPGVQRFETALLHPTTFSPWQ